MPDTFAVKVSGVMIKGITMINCITIYLSIKNSSVDDIFSWTWTLNFTFKLHFLKKKQCVSNYGIVVLNDHYMCV